MRIYSRYDPEKCLLEIDAENLREADLTRADLTRANLSRADLYGADLSRANLSRADLSRADLYGANLSEANLHGADLRGADLREADLRGADLTRANLTRASLRDASLCGARLEWSSHTLISEILRQSAGDVVMRRSLAGLIAISPDWCWDVWKNLDHPEREWALEVLRPLADADLNSPEWQRSR